MQTVPPIHLLQTLVAFADQENLVQTAERLGLTQPTVSRQLQQLEELFPQQLFTVQGRNKVLTTYGTALVAELRPRFHDLERIFEKVDQSFSEPKEITLRVGGRKELLNKFIVPTTFEGSLDLTFTSDESTMTQILEGNLDVAITDEIPNLTISQWLSKKLFNELPVLAVPKKWSTDLESAKEWSQKCSKHPACAYSKDLPHLGEFLEKYKTETQVHFFTSDWESLEKRINDQKSWSVIPSSYTSPTGAYQTYTIPGLYSAKTYYLYYRKELMKQDWMKDFIHQIT